MKPLCSRLSIFLLLFICLAAKVWAQYTISGKVTDEKGAAAAGAKVFIAGSQKITATDSEGKFIFSSLDPGTYQLTVQLLGYNPHTQNVLIQLRSVDLQISLTVKPIVLNTVNIGGDGNWQRNYELFKRHFLGIAPNSKYCEILNPNVLSFGTLNKKITAEADELLIIENKALGYRIRYLLKAFSCNPTTHVASYNGDPIFESMEGTDKEKARWAANRLNAYQGSLMHFLRAVYHKNALEEGFITNQLYVLKTSSYNFHADPRPVKFDTIVNVIDTSFVSAQFTSLYISYDKKRAAELAATPPDSLKARLIIDPSGSVLNLYLKEAIIDRKGSYVDYRTFLVQGLWGRRGIADQLPFEYQPTLIAN